MERRYLLFAISLTLCIVVVTDLPSLMAGSSMAEAGDARLSDVKFSHKMHITDIGLDCATCHPAALSSKLSSDYLGSTHNECMACHQDQLVKDCGFCHSDPKNIVARSAEDPELTFSHGKHLKMKDVECTTCHIGLEKVRLSSHENFPVMGSCIACHDSRGAINTCEACHTALDRMK